MQPTPSFLTEHAQWIRLVLVQKHSGPEQLSILSLKFNLKLLKSRTLLVETVFIPTLGNLTKKKKKKRRSNCLANVHLFKENLPFFSRLSGRRLPFTSGAFLLFSNRLTAIASRRTLAAGYSFNTSHISFFDSTNRSLQPTERTEAVRRFPRQRQSLKVT